MAKTKEFFSLSMNNQDIFYAELESIVEERDFDDRLRVVSECLERLVHRELLIVHLEDTKIDRRKIDKIVAFIVKNAKKIKKLAVVGVYGVQRFTLSLVLRKRLLGTGLHWKIMTDYQFAKEWVVSNKLS